MYYKVLESNAEAKANYNKAAKEGSAERMKLVGKKAAFNRRTLGPAVHSNPVR